MSALIRQVALVSESESVSTSDLSRVSAALQKQASRDLAPVWEISATVDAFAKLEDVPDGYWPMIVMDDIGFPGAAGIHLDKDGQPFALITSSPDLDTWALTASHEMCEMLVDPSGNRQVTGDSPKPGQGRVSFVVEVCDPSEAADFGYSSNGILVSDFYTPHFFDPVTASSVRYSFTGALKGPRQILRGGYLSWLDPPSGHLWQEVWFGGGTPTFRDLGPASAASGSLRAFIDSKTEADRAAAIARGRMHSQYAGLDLALGQRSSSGNAEKWRKQISGILGRSRRGRARATRRGKTIRAHR
jgi:hypothetical protein